jgi:hypothetical protein
MMPGLVMLLALAVVVAAFSLLAMSQDTHHQRALGRRLPTRQGWMLRVAGWGLLVVAAAVCIGGLGVGVGLVAWCGALTAAGLGVVLCTTYTPHWLARLAVAGAAAAGGLLLAASRVR